MINREWLQNSSEKEIRSFLEKNGSVFVGKDGNKTLLQMIYISSPEAIRVLDQDEFEKIKDNVWLFEKVLDKLDNRPYWIEEIILQDGKEISKTKKDIYCKNVLHIIDHERNVVGERQYILPVTQPKDSEHLKSEEIVFKSEIYNDDREIMILYPKNYNNQKKYKSLLVTDGEAWRHTMQLDSFLYEKLNDFMNDFVICYLYQKNRQTELSMSSDFLRFLSEEVFGILKRKSIVEKQSDLIFWGNSLGGLQGLYMAMQKIDFGAYICQSSSLWCDEEDNIIDYFKSLKDIDFEKLPRIYFSYGSEEIELITKKCKIMNEIIEDKPHIFTRIFKGSHDYFYWQEDLINALKILKEEL